MKFKNLNIDKIKADVKLFSLSNNNSYIESYAEFIQYFESLETINKHHLIISSHFVYGWMPTIVHLDTSKVEGVLTLLNEVKAGKMLNANELTVLKKCINNSVVGLSKLLHFINPHDYAIWDSRIYRYLTEKKTSYGIDKVDLYLEYLKGLKVISTHTDFSKIHSLVKNQIGYEITPMRTLEIIMFESDKQKNAPKPK